MRAAVAGTGDSSLQLLGVTVLTSFGREDLADLGYSVRRSRTWWRSRTRQAMDVGMDGIVASPLEAAAVRRIIGPDARSW